MILLYALLLCQSDTTEAARIVVQHEARTKPLDTFSRELMQFLTEKERFVGYRDPAGKWVEVFPGGDPVYAVLKMVAQPAEMRELRFIKITHPELKKTFGLDENLTYYSLADLQVAREKLLEAARGIDPEEATTEQRAVSKIVSQFRQIESLHREQLLAIIPVPFGRELNWITPADLRQWLAGMGGSDGRSQAIAQALEAFVAEAGSRREALQNVSAHWAKAIAAFATGDLSGFAGLAAELRALNPKIYMTESRLETELTYNRVRPFHWASGVLFVAALLYLLALAFESRGLGRVALAIVIAGLALLGYGYGLRWMIAGRYPLSNHYESMVMCAIGATVGTIVMELLMKQKHIIGLAGSIVASVLLVLANNVPTFASQGFVAPLVPALQTFWMTIHVPMIMTGYGMGMLLAVLGHIHLIRVIARRTDGAWTAHMDQIMYRVLQLTVLFLLVGIILGAVWAGEAWGRPWGWDMKETWALITLLCYLATMHARFVGVLKPFGHSFAALISFQILILTYYGVNFLFGKGLHTYGFGSGDWFWLSLFFGVEAIFLGVATAVHLRTGGGTVDQASGDALKMREE
jgi:cytochrome c-type biogenesis protein CcsB